jgi:hypothetical protein
MQCTRGYHYHKKRSNVHKAEAEEKKERKHPAQERIAKQKMRKCVTIRCDKPTHYHIKSQWRKVESSLLSEPDSTSNVTPKMEGSSEEEGKHPVVKWEEKSVINQLDQKHVSSENSKLVVLERKEPHCAVSKEEDIIEEKTELKITSTEPSEQKHDVDVITDLDRKIKQIEDRLRLKNSLKLEYQVIYLHGENHKYIGFFRKLWKYMVSPVTHEEILHFAGELNEKTDPIVTNARVNRGILAGSWTRPGGGYSTWQVDPRFVQIDNVALEVGYTRRKRVQVAMAFVDSVMVHKDMVSSSPFKRSADGSFIEQEAFIPRVQYVMSQFKPQATYAHLVSKPLLYVNTVRYITNLALFRYANLLKSAALPTMRPENLLWGQREMASRVQPFIDSRQHLVV